jgi:hypothetical protein
LRIRTISKTVPDSMSEDFRRLRDEWTAPDGWLLADAAFEVWRVARQFALGFYYRHDPRPPEDWWNARRAWCRFVRRVIQESEQFDSEFQVANACATGAIYCDEYANWLAIRDSFVPNTVAEWLSPHALLSTLEWGQRNTPGVIWTEHVAFAEALSELSGWHYYGEEGTNSAGDFVESADPAKNAILSIRANGTGRNLQAWNRALVVSPENSGVVWEQMLGRLHREGQKSAVEFDVMCHVPEHDRALDKARLDAEYIQETTLQQQKLTWAEWL